MELLTAFAGLSFCHSSFFHPLIHSFIYFISQHSLIHSLIPLSIDLCFGWGGGGGGEKGGNLG